VTYPKLSSIAFRLSTPADHNLPWLDHTMASAILTCPRYGMVRYYQSLTTDNTKREMPLECGSAMHLAFAAHRLYHLAVVQGHSRDAVTEKGIAIFGRSKWSDLDHYLGKEQQEQFCLQALYSSSFQDNPYDTKRTLSNMEVALIYYILATNYNEYPIYATDSFIGVEHKVDFVVTCTYEDGKEISIRYIGRTDGVHYQPENGKIIIAENKTTSSAGGEWPNQWEVSHQVTGYLIDMALKLNRPVTDAMVIGLQIPLPKLEYNGYVHKPVTRHPRQFAEWANWLSGAIRLMHTYADDAWKAPEYTHACFRYFRSCEFLPICGAEDSEMIEYRGLLQTKEWNPHDTE